MVEQEKQFFSSHDSIAVLGLSTRVYNCLRRNRIHTIDDLLTLQERDEYALYRFRNMGVKSVTEVKSTLQRVEIIGTESVSTEQDLDEQNVQFIYVIGPQVNKWLAHLLERNFRNGTLHREAKCEGQTLAHWHSVSGEMPPDKVFGVLTAVLGRNLSLCDELEKLMQSLEKNRKYPDRDLYIVMERFRPVGSQTLQEISEHLNLSRERVRQLQKQIAQTLASNITNDFDTLRIQSALLHAIDFGEQLTWNSWQELISNSGLRGRWQSDYKARPDPIDLMLSFCEALGTQLPSLQLPETLRLAFQFRQEGCPETPVHKFTRRNTVPKNTKQIVERHHRFSGGVDVIWLSRELNSGQTEIREMLLSLDFHCIGDNWFTQFREELPHNKNQVFHNALNKMLFFCGPLTVEELTSGLRHVVSRTDFPVPPPEVLEVILSSLDFAKEDGLFFRDVIQDSQLSDSETVIFECIRSNGNVVHHSELVKAFLDSELSLPSLHACLTRSPLFERVDKALYHLRGAPFTEEDVTRAREAANKVEIDLKVGYFLDGRLAVQVNLSPISIGSGVIVCTNSRFPNLSGVWTLYVEGVNIGEMAATVSEFRRLVKAFEILKLEGGERVEFLFDTHARKVNLSLFGEME